jgi:hypothetical protein
MAYSKPSKGSTKGSPPVKKGSKGEKDAQMFGKVMTDPFGRVLVSVILGLGLAALFRRACVGEGCVVIQAPDSREVEDYVYKNANDSCFRYTPNVVPCPIVKKVS